MKSDKNKESACVNQVQATITDRARTLAQALSESAVEVAQLISEAVFPQSLYCICCGNIIDSTRNYSLCDHCMEHIRWNVDEPREVDGIKVLRCADYGIYERSIIFAFKYDGHKYIARDIAHIMADRLRAEMKERISENHLVVPVPLHEKKYIKRGFNQSALIGKFLARELNWQIADVLCRLHETKALRGLGPAERMETITGSMGLVKESVDLIRDRDIILVDDFYTTGSTARECSRALREGAPRSISLIAFAGREWKKSFELT